MGRKNKDKIILDPKQTLFLKEYLDPQSPTFGNARGSALKAGYTETYASNITVSMPDWLLENIGNVKRLVKAEANLAEVQDLKIKDENGKVLTDVARERNKVDIFIASTIGKHKYSDKTGDAMEKIADKITGMRIVTDDDKPKK